MLGHLLVIVTATANGVNRPGVGRSPRKSKCHHAAHNPRLSAAIRRSPETHSSADKRGHNRAARRGPVRSRTRSVRAEEASIRQ